MDPAYTRVHPHILVLLMEFTEEMQNPTLTVILCGT